MRPGAERPPRHEAIGEAFGVGEALVVVRAVRAREEASGAEGDAFRGSAAKIVRRRGAAFTRQLCRALTFGELPSGRRGDPRERHEREGDDDADGRHGITGGALGSGQHAPAVLHT